MGGDAPRVEAFIDYSNMYIGARELFGGLSPHWSSKPGDSAVRPTGPSPDFGHFDPRLLAQVLADRIPTGGEARVLGGVHVFRGEPDRARRPDLWAHFRRACDRWEADGVHVHALPCMYRRHVDRMIEKGVDVALSLTAFDRAVQGRHRVAIVVSADQDLLPLITLLAGDRVPSTVEVAAWAADGLGSATILGVPGVVEHRVGRGVFDEVRVSNWEPPRSSPPTRLDDPV